MMSSGSPALFKAGRFRSSVPEQSSAEVSYNPASLGPTYDVQIALDPVGSLRLQSLIGKDRVRQYLMHHHPPLWVLAEAPRRDLRSIDSPDDGRRFF